MWWAWMLCKWLIMHAFINHPINTVDAGLFFIRMCINTYERVSRHPLITDQPTAFVENLKPYDKTENCQKKKM